MKNRLVSDLSPSEICNVLFCLAAAMIETDSLMNTAYCIRL